jgi:RHS repeat-associated protein
MSSNNFKLTESYVLGQGGEQLTTLTWNNGASTWQSTNVYGEGKLLATYDMIANPAYTPGGQAPQQIEALHFQLTDPLGTRRVQTNSAAEAELDCQSLPFGDQQSCFPDPNAPNNEADEDATGTQTPIHFTNKQHDNESGNDYFGARYNSSVMGCWMSPDLPFADQDPSNPQSWNLYGYVRNNPLNSIDDSGLLTIVIGGTGYKARNWNYSHSPLTAEAQEHFNDPAVGFLYWSGALSDTARIEGAEQLRKMINNYSFAPGEQLNIIAHSHGGNVALLASHLDLNHRIDNLITLGTPHFGSDTPDWRNIGAWYNIQASTDWVPGLGGDAPASTRAGAINYTVPTPGLGHFGEAHTALWGNSTIRGLWWNQIPQAPCARTSTNDTGNPNGQGSIEASGCQ